MRDTIKNKEYFDTFIEEDSKRIRNFTNKLNLGQVPAARIGIIKERIMSLHLGIFIAQYSRGDKLKDLQISFKTLFDSWLSTFNANNYDANLKMLSLSTLFNLDKELKVAKSKLNNVEDWLFNYILSGENNFKLVYPAHYERLQSILKENNAPMLIDYAKCGWFDEELECFFSHKSTENLYYGYWCFEVAAIIKKMKIDDSELKDTRFYPYDLVHFEQ